MMTKWFPLSTVVLGRNEKLPTRFYLLMLATLLVCASTAIAQGLEIAGQVIGKETNEPLAGANVRVKGTNLGASTNINGNFRLVIKDVTEATLVVSYVGYKTVEVQVTSSTKDLKVSIEQDPLKTSEVVVTGFVSTVKRENLANTVATVSARELVSVPAQTLEQALSGKFAGITVSQNTGAPGGGINVNLRGVSTIEGRTQPLYVVDGVIVNNAANQSGIDLITKATVAGSANPQGQAVNRIADINPNEIETIEVLKGASAAALYGSKATNGVVIITTKQGTPGRTKIDVVQQVGINSILHKVGTRQFTAETAKKQYGDPGLQLFQKSGGQFIDYEDVLYGQKGALNETSISASGGSEETQFFASGLLRDENGIVKHTGYKKYAGRFNLNHKISDRVRINTSVNVLRTASDRAITGNDNSGTTLGISLAFTPSFLDIRPVNGVYPDHPFNSANPLQTRDLLTNNEVVFRTMGSGRLQWNILQTQEQILDFIAQGGVDFYSQENKVISPPELQYERNSTLPGASILTETRSTNSNLYLNLAHSYSTSSNIIFKTSTGVQFENQDINYVLNEARGLIVTQTNVNQAASVNALQQVTKQRELGFYVQEELDLSDKVYLTGGLRGDASSANGNPNRFFLFPKVSSSIRLSQFDFWRNLSDFSPEFKVRAAYGETGNLPPPDAKFTSLAPRNIGGLSGLLPATRRGASNVKPERTKELELGFDATLLRGNATLEFTFFRKTSSDLLLIHTLPPSSGFVDEFINGGAMRTNGVEVSLGATPFRGKDFSWTSRLNFYKTSPEITELVVPAFNKAGFATFLGTYRIEKGLSPTTIIGADVDASGKNIKLGDETPDFQMSFNNTFTLSNFELSFLWEWKQGGDVINLGKLLTDLGGTTGDYDEIGSYTIKTKDKLRDSVVTGKKGDLRLALLGITTKPYVEDGTYLKLREARLSYTLSQDLVRSLFGSQFSYIRVAVGGRNLLMFTKYTEYDPEVSQFGNVAIGRSIDVLPFPSSRSFYFTLNFGL